MTPVDELRPLTAGRLLALWRDRSAETAEERALLCNAAVLAESCFYLGAPAFTDVGAVLEALTPQEMERLLRLLSGGGQPAAVSENPAFDDARFRALREG